MSVSTFTALTPVCPLRFTRRSPYPEQFQRPPSPSNARHDQSLVLSRERRFCAPEVGLVGGLVGEKNERWNLDIRSSVGIVLYSDFVLLMLRLLFTEEANTIMSEPKSRRIPHPISTARVCRKPRAPRLFGILNYEMSLSHFFQRNPLTGSVTAAMCRISKVLRKRVDLVPVAFLLLFLMWFGYTERRPLRVR